MLKRKELAIDCPASTVENIRVPTSSFPVGVASRSATNAKTPYYLTTAINYTNGWPHIGHAYEAVVADVIARHHRLYGKDVFFCTGTDEHGQKIAAVAEAAGVQPIDNCTKFKNGFVALNERLEVSNDYFIRTVDNDHKATCQALWKRCVAAGDIYLDKYEGYYWIREEKYVTDTEAAEMEYKDPVTGAPLTKMSEASYFFRLSKYHEFVLDAIKSDPEFISPAQYRSEIIARLEKEPLRDLSISRATFKWGVPVPDDEAHVMYVWFDALTNYASAVHALDASDPLSRYWPCDSHIVGKDIIWFHCVIWPAMLKSAGIALPRKILVHGFVLDKEGKKMSKSLGNVVDPHSVVDKFPAESFRWYICAEVPFGSDLKYTEEGLRLTHNADLCDKLGNLVSRTVALCGGKVPEAEMLNEVPFALNELIEGTLQAFAKHALSEAAMLVRQATSAVNEWLTKQEPWKCKDEIRKAQIVRTLVEYVYVLAHFWAPFIPVAAEKIFDKLGSTSKSIVDLVPMQTNLEAGAVLPESSSVLFKVYEGEKPVLVAKPSAAPAVLADTTVFSRIDLRVGTILEAEPHPGADRLFVEKIDLGEIQGPRQIISGLREHYTAEQLRGRKVLVVANLKPRKMVGVESNGMVLCASSAEGKVELVQVHGNVPAGTRVEVEGEILAPALDAKQADKAKAWEALAAGLRVDADGTACFEGTRLLVNSKITLGAPTVRNAPIA